MNTNFKSALKLSIIITFLFTVALKAQWNIVNFPNTQKINDISLFGSNEVMAFCNTGIFLSIDAGINWNQISSTPMNEVEFLNYNTGYGLNGYGINKTTDHGFSWGLLIMPDSIIGFNKTYTLLNVIENGKLLMNVNSQTSLPPYASTYFHQIFLTTNEGTNWSNIFTCNDFSGPSGLSYENWNQKIYFVNQDTGFLFVNYHNVNPFSRSFAIKKTINGGRYWINMFTKDNCNVGDVYFLNDSVGYFVLQPGIGIALEGLYRTTNYGENWDTLSLFRPSKFQFTNFYTAYTPGYCSSNGGANWVNQINPSGLNGIKFINNLTGYVFGNNGIIYKTTNGGGIKLSINQSSSEIPDNFSLSQNYPNPFNPSTVIGYRLSVAGFTTLKVFDLLGKEVAQLVNEKQNAGSYAVDFNSSDFNLPSGIYFYTLNAGEFKETKKMVLVK
jgi:hypothetical protein